MFLFCYNNYKNKGFLVEYEEYRRILKELGLTIKDFSLMIDTSYGTVRKWGKDGRAVPNWVKSWLDIYIENQQLKKSKDDDCEEYKALAKALQGVMNKESTPQTPQ